MTTEVIIGLLFLAGAGLGLIFYLIKLNRQAKQQQSEVDPAKLRRWSDD